jgi:nucleotide-binding universal stress UspA family protein
VEEQLEEGSDESLDPLAGELRGQGIDVDCRSIAGTSAAHALHDAAEDAGAGLLVVGDRARRDRELDLLVCGSRRYGPAQAVLLGGVSRRVAEAHCPVIMLARGGDGGLESLVDQGAGQRYS